MKRTLFLSFLVMWSAQVFAATTTSVRLNPDYDLIVNARLGGVTTELGSAEPSGDATAETAPARVYIPMSGLNAEVNYFLDPKVPNLFSAADTSDVVIFPLYINATANDYYLYLATKVGATTDYKITAFVAAPFNGSTNLDQNIEVTVKDICDQYADCSSFSSSQVEKTTMGYFFMSTTAPGALPKGTVALPTVYTGGIFFEINMSNRVYTANQLIPTISEVRPGDRRVIIKYSLSAGILKPKAIRVFNHGSNTPIGNLPFRNYTGTLEDKQFEYFDTGEVTLTDRFNGVISNYSILAMDLYRFGTVLSEEVEGSSKSIEELLKANNCFLLTAGFGENHPVIDYFRHFRDTVLVNSFLGREFIHYYYELAPKYALMLYQSETLRAMVRGAAYVLYFIFNYYLVILAGALLTGSGIYLYKKREKIKI